MAWLRVLVLLLLWPLQSMGQSMGQAMGQSMGQTAEEFRALVVADDRAGVEAALRAAIVQDAAPDIAPEGQRNMFDLFTDTQPEIAAFTSDWLLAAPDNALAMTARGWHLQARGWNARGRATAGNVHPDAMAVLRADHAAALALAEAALAVESGLIAASDLKQVLTTTLGNPEVIPGELERVMALQPNPVLDYARLQDALTYLGPPEQRVKVLEAVKAKRNMTRNEAYALDAALAEIAGGLNLQVEWKAYLPFALDWNREAANQDPFDPEIVTAYVGNALDAKQNLGTPLDVPDLIRRLQRLLTEVPWSADAWAI